MARGGGGGGSSGGSPNQALIIFLVFFVLASIALGVTTYLGFDGQAQLVKDKEKAESKSKEQEALADWYKFQEMVMRQTMGDKLNDDEKKAFTTLKDRFDKNDLLPAAKANLDPRKADTETFLKATLGSKDLDFDPKAVQFNKTYPDLIKARQKLLDDKALEVVKEQDNHKQTQTALAMAQKNLADLKKEYETKFTASKDDAAKDLAKKLNGKENDKAEIAKLGQEKEDLRLEHEKEVVALQKQLKDLGRVIGELNDRVKIAEAKVPKDKEFEYGKAKGHIKSTDPTGSMPFIDLGSADNLKPGIKFTVGLNGDPKNGGKAQIEVVAVLGPHHAQTRVLKFDPNESEEKRLLVKKYEALARTDPIVPNDAIFNATWDPNYQQHVILLGAYDLSAGGNEMSRLLQMLAASDIVVDGYFDFNEGAMKGKAVAYDTDFLIMGDMPKDSGKVREEVEKEAQRKGVKIISLRRFMHTSGLQVPRSLAGAQGRNPTDPPPGGKPEVKPPMPGDMPPPKPGDEKPK